MSRIIQRLFANASAPKQEISEKWPEIRGFTGENVTRSFEFVLMYAHEMSKNEEVSLRYVCYALYAQERCITFYTERLKGVPYDKWTCDKNGPAFQRSRCCGYGVGGDAPRA
ncbi:hypothetical protein KDA_58200 [Dictyobacter alpinus]|uniref:Uncharacterized protein n=1 Tax=Dictyobacter alpinus TaxID=2014873 RepID=A0A402BG01_9CHLR|nr:hypothetical protein KDA_57880 [Dictyobacter alpinus]GCE30336.1 hypothetical protein KDA_58200 [Dictyobacter alpinus]